MKYRDRWPAFRSIGWPRFRLVWWQGVLRVDIGPWGLWAARRRARGWVPFSVRQRLPMGRFGRFGILRYPLAERSPR